MSKTAIFHHVKSNLESALIDFLNAAIADDRDLTDEINEALFNSCKEARCKQFKVIED